MASAVDERASLVHAAARTPILRADRSRPVPATYTQERTYRAGVVDPSSYTVAVSVRIRGPLQPHALERALGSVVHRHEVLRTTFEEVGGEVRQVVHDPPGITLDVVDAAEDDVAPRLDHLAAQPFDLGTLPLQRFELLRLRGDEHVLLRVSHHILDDAWSWRILLRDLDAAYRAALDGQPDNSPPLVVQIADHAVWERALVAPGTETYERQMAWWRGTLADPPPPALLPFARPVPDPTATIADGVREAVVRDAADAVRLAAQRLGATLNTSFVAAHVALLASSTGADDLVAGIYTSVRRRTELQDLIGFFTNLLAVRFPAAVEVTAAAWTVAVRGIVEAASANADVPWQLVREELARSSGGPPDVQTILNQRPAGRATGVGGLVFEPPVRHRLRMPWGVALVARARGDDVVVRATSDATRNDPDALEAHLARLGRLVVDMAEHPDVPMRRLLGAGA
jgi:hypothetical protein